MHDLTRPVSGLRTWAQRRPTLVRLVRALRRARGGAQPAAAAPASHREWMAARVEWRRARYRVAETDGLFSLLTCVWNTPAPFLRDLAASVLGQDYRTFEWVVLDNASTDPETGAVLAELAADPRVRLLRSETNLGIVGGLRRCLDAAAGRYVLTVDHDDLLYEDALRVVAWHVHALDFPPLLYSDEDKLLGDELRDPYFKPPWDPVLFLNSAYIAHLGALDRARALELGCYTDGRAEGSHDWDSFMRFFLAGETPAHVPEVLYTWRIHSGSTAADIGSKSYVPQSQTHVLRAFLEARGVAERYEIVMSPYVDGTPDWWFAPHHAAERPVVRAEVTPDERAAVLLPAAQEAAAADGLVRVSLGGLQAVEPEWERDALALFELHPDTVAVTGRVLGLDERIVSAGEYLGFGGDCGSPDAGAPASSSGYHMQLWKQRSVDAASTLLCVVDGRFLLDTLKQEARAEGAAAFLGAWLGAAAARSGRRVVYSPYLVASGAPSRHEWDGCVRAQERARFARETRDLASTHSLLAPVVERDAARAWTAASPQLDPAP